MRAEAGIVVDPGDKAGFVAAAARLRQDADLRAKLGRNGRAYAESTFDVSDIADRFEAVLSGRPRATPATFRFECASARPAPTVELT
jgi:glycosyltransferase involved in cell wall biosynthesis